MRTGQSRPASEREAAAFAAVPSKVPAENGASFVRAYARLRDAIGKGRGLVVVTGGEGVGKTALVRRVVEDLSCPVVWISASDPRLAARVAELGDAIASAASAKREGALAREQGVRGRAGRDGLGTAAVEKEAGAQANSRVDPVQEVSRLYCERSRELDQSAASLSRVAVVVDDAHLAQLELLERIRLATESYPGGSVAVCLVLVGREELRELLGQRRARALATRVCLQLRIGPISLADTSELLYGRMRRAGIAEPERVLPRATVRAIRRHGRGRPAQCLEIARISLLEALAGGTPRVTRRQVGEASRRIEQSASAKPAQAVPKAEAAAPKRLLIAAGATAAFATGLLWVSSRQWYSPPGQRLASVGTAVATSASKGTRGDLFLGGGWREAPIAASRAAPAGRAARSVPLGASRSPRELRLGKAEPQRRAGAGESAGANETVRAEQSAGVTASPARAEPKRSSPAPLRAVANVAAGQSAAPAAAKTEGDDRSLPVREDRGDYAVQVAAFATAARASIFLARLGDRFGHPVIREAASGGRAVYRVRYVGLPDSATASALKKRLEEAGFSAFVVRERR